MVTMNADAETNILRCMDVGKCFSVNGTPVKEIYRAKGELSR